jgi:[acyl-carrier-protein] S-malonyltransferase
MSGPLAILCSGQGGQHAEMFNLFADCPASEPIFAAAAGHLEKDPRRFVREAPAEALFSDRVGQILCSTQALALWAALDTAQPSHAVIAGLSVGEVAAWGCSGALEAAGAIRLTQSRAAIMDSVAPKDSGLAGIIGLTRETLDPIIEHHGAAVAIIYDTDSFVIGGPSNALEACCRDADARGAKRAVRIKVSVPSHTSLLANAVAPFRAALREAAPQAPNPSYRLLSGIDGDAVHDVAEGSDKLARQICTTVNWAACLESCREAGAASVLELGPGRALSHMAAPLFPEGRVRSSEDFRTLSGLQSWLSRTST